MRKAVEEHLESRGCRVVRPPAEPAPITLEGLVDGFLVHVLRLDPESYRRAFWREAYRNGHTIGHVPRTFEGFFRRNARTFEQKVSLFLALTALFGVYTVAALLHGRLSLVLRRLRRPGPHSPDRRPHRPAPRACCALFLSARVKPRGKYWGNARGRSSRLRPRSLCGWIPTASP